MSVNGNPKRIFNLRASARSSSNDESSRSSLPGYEHTLRVLAADCGRTLVSARRPLAKTSSDLSDGTLRPAGADSGRRRRGGCRMEERSSCVNAATTGRSPSSGKGKVARALHSLIFRQQGQRARRAGPSGPCCLRAAARKGSRKESGGCAGGCKKVRLSLRCALATCPRP